MTLSPPVYSMINFSEPCFTEISLSLYFYGLFPRKCGVH